METEIRESPASGLGVGAPKVIKRYANRKLYDTGESRYVTLDEIGAMVKQGLEVQIVDNRSKGDLTSVTLAQTIFEEEKKRSRMPLEVLRDIIRNGGETISGFIQRELQPRVSSLRGEAETGLNLLRRDVPGERPRELLASFHALLQEWQGRVDERLHAAVETMSAFPQLARELQQIAGRLGELQTRIDHLEEGAGRPPDERGPPQARIRILMTSALLLAVTLAQGLPPAQPSAAKKRPPVPPARVTVPSVKGRPLLSNPQLSVDGRLVYVARTGVPSSPLAEGLDVMAIPLAPDQKAETIHFPLPVKGDQVKLLLPISGKHLAVLSQGELWIKELGATADAHRLYPPAEGGAPLGPVLSQASFAADSSWLLIESPKGWGRISLSGEFGALPLHAMDLTGGSMEMSPDGTHAIVAKPQRGEGYVNGSHVLALNITTAFVQGLDVDNLYTEALFLPDGHALGKDASGTVWLLRPKSRLAYFTPPRVPKGASIGGYAINFAATKLAWTVTVHADGKDPRAELWVAGAPSTPEPPKTKGEE